MKAISDKTEENMGSNSGIKKPKKTFFLMTGLCILVIGASFSDTFAWRGGSHGGGRGERYYFHGGRFYHPSRFWYDVAVLTPPIGVVIEALPFGYTSFMVGDDPYYYYQGSYFRPCPSGYIVVPVPAPAVVAEEPQAAVENKAQPAAPAAQAPAPAQSAKQVSGDSVVINVPDKNGGYYPVVLVKRGNGYVGPQGEFYAGHPTVDQLKVLYGK